jgi:cytochrome c5
MSEEHGSLIKNIKQLSIAVIASFFIPLIIIFLLIVYVSSGKKVDTNSSEQTTLALIKPVGQLNFKDASAPREMLTGEAVYKAVCASCHNSGAAGAPKFADASSWGGRIGKGYEALYTSVMKGLHLRKRHERFKCSQNYRQTRFACFNYRRDCDGRGIRTGGE